MCQKQNFPNKNRWSNKKAALRAFRIPHHFIVFIYTLIILALLFCSVINGHAGARYLTNFVPANSVYEDIYNRSISLVILPKNVSPAAVQKNGILGTGWLLDYEYPPPYKIWTSSFWYPSVFYFATNLHIACVHNLNLCHVFVKTGFLNRKGVVVNERQIVVREAKLIYSGHNFIKKEHLNHLDARVKIWYSPQVNKLRYVSPRNFDLLNASAKTTETDWLNIKEKTVVPMIDFAVIRIVFQNTNDAIFATHNFVNRCGRTTFWGYDDVADDLLEKKRWYLGGYPYGTWAINSTLTEERSTAFQGKEIDWFMIKNKLYTLTPFRAKTPLWEQFNNVYAHYGVQFVLKQSGLGSGSSGSLVCDEQGNIVGINWGGTKADSKNCLHVLINRARYLAKSRSDYGEFEQLIIPYDLIHRNAYSTSFEEALKNAYPKVRTHLFNGQ